MTTDPIEAIRARAAAAKPGPWIWRGNVDYDDPRLVSRGGSGSDVLGHIRVELTRADAERAGVTDPDRLDVKYPEKRDDESMEDYGRRCDDPNGPYEAALTAAQDQAVRDWLDNGYGDIRTEDRMGFVVDFMYREARKLPVFEVAPNATDRNDPDVYRADIVGVRHPDAEFIAAARQDVDTLLAEVDRLRAELAAAKSAAADSAFQAGESQRDRL